MIKIKKIEEAVSHLDSKQLAQFRAWFNKFDAARWDRQLEEDARSGKLDRLASKSLEDLKKGKYKEL